jgi:adenine deaminase
LLQPGDSADFILVDDLSTFKPREVWLRGECVARDGQSFLPCGETIVRNKFAAEPLTLDDVRVPAPARCTARVIGIRDGQLVTDHLTEPFTVRSGAIDADLSRDIIKIVVCNRYTPARPAVALVKGFGLTRGAIASSVAHDSHHIIAVGVTDEALVTAINEVIMRKGGLAVADNNRKVLTSLPLPLAGLMSIETPEIVARAYSDCDALAKILGTRLTAPFMMLSFLALPVIPRLKLTDKGLFDGEAFQHVPLFLTP